MHCFKGTEVQMIVWHIRKHYKVFKHFSSFYFILQYQLNAMFNFEDISKLYMLDTGIYGEH